MMIFAKNIFNVIESVLSRLSSTRVGTLDRNGAFGWKNIDGETAVRFVDNSWSIIILAGKKQL